MSALRTVLLAAIVIATGIVALVGGAGRPGDHADASGLAAAAVSAGSGHTCAVTTSGRALCWGSNREGQVGDGGVCGAYCTTPVAVPQLAGAIAINSGDHHTCALTTAGGVQCWGENNDGQLGDGTTTERGAPVSVSDLAAGVSAVSSGDLHTCAIVTAGSVKCWGRNVNGQIGDGAACGTICTTPIDVLGVAAVAAVSAGNAHTCAVTATATVACWGHNLSGQLGDGTISARTTPVLISGLGGNAVAVSAGHSHTCALSDAGGVMCWGDNAYGQLGDGTTTDSSVPVTVEGLGGGVTAISAGDYSTCALLAVGTVECWGMYVHGPISEGAFIIRTEPARVSALGAGVLAISAGDYHSCALISGGSVMCWGYNSSGQLGNGGIWTRARPAEVIGLGSEAPKPTEAATLTATDTPTATDTATPSSTPTASPTGTAKDAPTATDTARPSSTPTPTPTVTPQRRKGDANGNGVVNAVDATLILQFAAELVPAINASADVNHDGRVDSLDAALVLQSDAGLNES